MKPEFIIQRQGKSMVLYAGLLDLAHERGLQGISTELIQIPRPDNDNVAICCAVAQMVTAEGQIKSFAGIGDAAPNNVGPNIKTAIIRMAETRAKARALRDAVNIGMVTAEELGPDEEDEQPRATRQQATRASKEPTPIRKDVNPPASPSSEPVVATDLGRKILASVVLAAGELRGSEPASNKAIQAAWTKLNDAFDDPEDKTATKRFGDQLCRYVFGREVDALTGPQVEFLVNEWGARAKFTDQAYEALLAVIEAEQAKAAAN